MTDTTSRQITKEISRTYDKVRVKNPEDPSQYVDVERPKKIKSAPEKTGERGGATSEKRYYAPQPKVSHVEILEEDLTRENPDYMPREGTEDI